MKQLLVLFTIFFLLALHACEKEELIVIDDGLQFCPIRFNAKGGNQGVNGCPIVDITPMPANLIKPDRSGVIIEQPLIQRHAPFIAAYDPDSSTSRAIHLSSPQSKHRIIFDKIDMDLGTRISWFLGGTRCPSPFGFCFFGDIINDDVRLGPSPSNAWQIFVQRELDGTYSFGYMADSIKTIATSGISDFKTCTMEMTNKGEKSVFNASLTQEGVQNPISSIDTEGLHLPPFPSKMYIALGFDLLPSLWNDCEKRFVKIDWKMYEYNNLNSPHNLLENFDCLTIVKI
jgi:hypothetical protein